MDIKLTDKLTIKFDSLNVWIEQTSDAHTIDELLKAINNTNTEIKSLYEGIRG